jgi:hypothetical protein
MERPGLPVWVRVVVTTACLLTIIVAGAGPTALLEQVPALARQYDVSWIRSGLVFLLGVWIVVSLVPLRSGASWLQLTVLLPLGQLVAMLIAWGEWTSYAELLPSWMRDNPIMYALPPSVVVLSAGLACFAAGSAIARRRLRDALQVAAMIALLDLLLLGLWLPLAADICAPDIARWWDDLLIADAFASSVRSTLVVALVPPLVAAIGLAALSHRTRTRALSTAWRAGLGVGLACATLAAMSARGAATYTGAMLYLELTPVLLATAIATTGLLVALAGSLWLRDRRSRRALASDPHRLTGLVTARDGDDCVGGVAITSWLRGPALVLAPCAVTTPAGELVVPGGAELIAHLPDDTQALRFGDSTPVLRTGERVTLAGYAPPADGHPFRDSAALVPGHVRIARATDRGGTAADIALAMWRPCVAYLLILATIALPAIVH